ncbi:hypothetical protein [Halalkalibacter oceani]|uniref:hypothetical protein n=1 Tax=Halalkalibacter oceani TaxID=1653776 RepID=UPI003390E6A6
MESMELILKELQTLNERVQKLEQNMATKDDIANMATKDDIANMATKDDIANMATKDDIANMATKDDIANMATKDDIHQLNNKLDAITTQVTLHLNQDRTLNDLSQKVNDHEMDIRLLKRMIATN